MVAQETSFEEALIASLEQALAHKRGEAPLAVKPRQIRNYVGPQTWRGASRRTLSAAG